MWLLLARRAGRIPTLQAPRLAPIAAFAACSVVTSLVAGLSEYDFGDTEILLVAITLMAFALGRARAGVRP